MRCLLISIICAMMLQGCTSGSDLDNLSINQEFADHWFAGTAEVISYDLVQSRYGEPREGHAVLIFVTEPFSRSHHVKLDNPEEAGTDKVTVMKLNMTKKFITGIYPYSMMLSVFSPADNDSPPHPLKVTMSSQEWCGQVFAQLNRKQRSYQLQEFSYFQSEGDGEYDLSGEWMEDEIWNLIRLDPSSLPVGEIEIYPGLFYTRLSHLPMKAGFAEATRTTQGNEEVYKIRFSSGRTFEWRFSGEFPYTINSWREEYPDRNGAMQVTTGTIKKSLEIPYWQYNGREDIILRDSLGIQ